MATPDVTQKTDVYETLSGINLAFAAIVEHLQTMRQSRILRGQYGRVLQGLAHELRAEINVELLDKMNQIEMQDWTRYGKCVSNGRSTCEVQNQSGRKYARLRSCRSETSESSSKPHQPSACANDAVLSSRARTFNLSSTHTSASR